jgi:protein-S-isoprenylcysteine O-methyltransferase Ste14
MNQLQNSALARWAMRHPRLAAWIVLGAGMVILLVIEAWSVGLSAGNWVALVAATILVAGACVWIISWEDRDEEAPPQTPGSEQPQ